MKKTKSKNAHISMQEFIGMLDKPAEIDGLFSDGSISAKHVNLALELFESGNDHRACAFLVRCAKKKAMREEIQKHYQTCGREKLHDKLKAENAKMRKNTSRLIGALGEESDVQALAEALENEDVRMVIPSMLLALGAVGGEYAKNILNNYEIKKASDETEQKHEREEAEAKRKALSSFSSGRKHKFIGFEKIDTLQLICAKDMASCVADDCESFGLTVQNYSQTTVNINGDSLSRIYAVRSFRELLIPVCKGILSAKQLQIDILSVLDAVHENTDEPYRYRIEYRGQGDRRARIESVRNDIECERLCNSPSDYEVEVRVYDDSSIKLKLFTYADERFLYRKAALPASIHPANAASVMSFAKKYFKDDACVLDICCGSGTMLFEREKCKPCRRLMGVDISEKAIEAAKQNRDGVKNSTLLYRGNCIDFKLRDRVDEVIANLPFGNRVGTHENNEKLYFQIVQNLKKWLKPQGIALLYTMEYKLLKTFVDKYDCYRIEAVKTTEAGGLFPTVCIIRYIGSND